MRFPAIHLHSTTKQWKKRKSAPLEVIVHFGRPSSNGEGRLGSDWIWRWRITSIRNPILGMVLRSSYLHNVFLYVEWGPWGRLNIKMSSYQYRDHHVKDKTVSPTVLSLTWESPYLGKTVFILRQGLMIVAEAIAPGPVNMETVFPYIHWILIIKIRWSSNHTIYCESLHW